MPKTTQSPFTVEEINLIAMYHTLSRGSLANTLRGLLAHVTDAELIEITQRTLAKLERMTDAEYDGFAPYAAQDGEE